MVISPLARAVAVALITASALPALASDPAAAQQRAQVLDRVVVSASTSRMPESEASMPNTITVIDREQLKQQLAVTQDLSQVLANLIPSFTPSRQKMTNAGETLRGRKPLYLVDGMPQSTPLREGGRDGHTIDPAMIERIEVIHGANALQGLGASGGLINIITKRAPIKDGEVFHDVSVGASTALPNESDSTGWRAAYLFGTRQGDFDIVGGVSVSDEGLYYDAEGRAIAVSDVQGDLMDARSRGFFLKTGWRMDEDRRLQLNLQDYKLESHNGYRTVDGNAAQGILATSAQGGASAEGPYNDSRSVSLDYTDRALAGGYLQAQAYFVDFAALYGGSNWGDFWGDGRDLNWVDQSQNRSEKTGAKLGWSRSIGENGRVTLGLDWSRDTTRQAMVRSGLDWVPETSYTAISPFVQGEWRIGESLLLSGGLRHERGKLSVDDFTTLPSYNGGQAVQGGIRESSETLPNIGLVWEASDFLKLYASYSEGYTVADIGRVLRAINTPGQRVENLIDLTPVVSDNREIGMDFDNGRWSTHLAYYESLSELGSRLAFDRVSQTYNVVRERTEIQGIEGNLAFRPTDATRVGVLFALTRGEYDSNGDDKVDSDLPGINVSPDRIGAFWEQQWRDGFSTRVQANQARDRTFDRRGVQVASFDGYTTLDASARFGLPIGQLSVGIENLTNRQYVTYYSQSTPRNDTYTAGRGRTLTLGWNHRF